MYSSFDGMTDEQIEQHLVDNAQAGSMCPEMAQQELIKRNSARMADEVRKLNELIEQFNRSSTKLTKWMLALTWVIAVLTLVMAVAPVSQIIRWYNAK